MGLFQLKPCSVGRQEKGFCVQSLETKIVAVVCGPVAGFFVCGMMGRFQTGTNRDELIHESKSLLDRKKRSYFPKPGNRRNYSTMAG